MTVNQNAARAGKKYESDLMKLFREERVGEIERLRLTGVEDEGDLIFINTDGRWIIEAKRRRTLDLAGWVREAEVERDNYARHRGWESDSIGFIVVHHARGKNIRQSYVTTTLEEWLSRL